MKKSLLFIPKFVSLIVFSLLLVQCSKDDDTPSKTKAELLLGSWQRISDNFSPAYDFGTGTPVTNAFAIYSACEKDDLYTFKVSNQGEFNEGAAKCDVDDAQTTPFIYQLDDVDSKLMIVGFYEFNIEQLDKTTMKISTTFMENGTSYTQTITFTRK